MSDSEDIPISDQLYVANEDDVFINQDGDSFEFVTDPFELHEKYQEYMKANGSRNNSTEIFDIDDRTCASSSSSVNGRSGGESEAAFQDVEWKELVQRNKTYRQRNEELREKNDLLLRQLEAFEDENEQKGNEISTLEKELKCCHDMIRHHDKLESEIEQMQVELIDACDSKTKLEENVKRLKKDEDDLIMAMNSIRDQNDCLTNDLVTLTATNKGLCEENALLKAQHESIQEDIELKDKELEQKMQLYQELRIQAEDHKTSIQDLREDKEALMNQLHEVQLEVSIYQNFHKVPDEAASPTTLSPRKGLFSLQSEIAEAEQDVEQSFMFSNLGGRANSPMNEMVRSFLTNRSNVSTPLNTPRLDTPVRERLNDPNGSLFFPPIRVDVATQTKLEETVDGISQTEEDLMSSEELMTLTEQSAEYQEQLELKAKQIEDLNEMLDHQKNKEHYFTAQLSVNRTKSRELIAQNQKHTQEMTQLTDINMKLCTSKLSVWYNDLQNTTAQLASGDCPSSEIDLRGSVFDGNSSISQLVDALCLDGVPHLKLRDKEDPSFENMEQFTRKAQILLENDRKSLRARLFVLYKCKRVIEDALTKKIDLVRDMVRDAIYGEHFCSSRDNNAITPSLNLSQDISNHLRLAHCLMQRSGSYAIGALESETRHNHILKTFVKHFRNMQMKSEKLNYELRQCKKQCKVLNETPVYTSPGLSDISIIEVAPSLLRPIILPPNTPDWVKKLMENQQIGNILQSAAAFSCTVHRRIVTMNRTTILAIFLLLCMFFSISPVDYKVEPVI